MVDSWTYHGARTLHAIWLLKLRWVAVVGQMLTIASVHWGLGIDLPLSALLAIVVATVVSNLLLYFLLRVDQGRTGTSRLDWDVILGFFAAMDLLSLTGLLYATGGVTNPFILFYYVNLGLGAVLLKSSWAWGLNLLALICFTWLLYDYRHVPMLDLNLGLEPIRWTGQWGLVQMGLWLAFAASSTVIVYFLTRLTSALRQREVDLRRAQQVRSDMDKFEALGTLAAGTAHELATPLSTIAVVAREVEKAIETLGEDQVSRDIVDDVHLIRNELDRCRKILDRMSSQAGQTVGEMIRLVSWARIWGEVMESLAERERVRWAGDVDLQNAWVVVPVTGFAQAIRGIVQNGLDASPPGAPVTVTLRQVKDRWRLTVTDQGSGMSEDVLKRVSEPFFTTKPPGQGMGLGVFLARGLVRRLGGEIQFASDPNRGTTVSIELPVASP